MVDCICGYLPNGFSKPHNHTLLFFKKKIYLQNFLVFSQTSTWISHRYTYVPSLRRPFPLHPSRLSQNTGLSSLFYTANSHLLSVLHMVMCMFQCYSLSSSHSVLPLLCPQVCFLCVYLSFCSANRSISTIFLDSICCA